MKIYHKDKLSDMAYDCLPEPLFSLVYVCYVLYLLQDLPNLYFVRVWLFLAETKEVL